MTELFERASRAKIRFATTRGLITVEDLWALPLTSRNGISLNDAAKTVSALLKEEGEEDFVGTGSTVSVELNLAMDVIKRVIEVRLAENKAKSDAKVNQSHNAEIDAIIAQKKIDEMKSKSIEDLEKLRK